MSSSVILTSPVFKSFLLSSPISLTAEEEEDAKKREEADRVREDGRQKFAKEIANRVDALRDAVKSVKGDIMGKGDLWSFLLDEFPFSLRGVNFPHFY